MRLTKLKKSRVILLLLVFALVFATGCQGQGQEAPPEGDQPEKIEINMGGGPVGSATELLWTIMMDDFNSQIPGFSGGQTSGAPVPNIMGLAEGQYNLVQSISDSTAAAMAGIDLFEEVGPIEGLKSIFTTVGHTSTWIVRADSPFESIYDLVGKKICSGPRGSSNEVATQRLLDAIGLSYDDFNVSFLSFADAEQQMLDKHLDAMLFSFTTYPHPSLLSVISKDQVRFLPIPEEAISGVLAKYKDGVYASTLPAGTYTLVDGSKNPEIKGIGGNVHLLVKEEMSEELVYQMVKVFAENFPKYQESVVSLKKMKVEDMAKEVPGIGFHQGALRYFKEAGFID